MAAFQSRSRLQCSAQGVGAEGASGVSLLAVRLQSELGGARRGAVPALGTWPPSVWSPEAVRLMQRRGGAFPMSVGEMCVSEAGSGGGRRHGGFSTEAPFCAPLQGG